MQVKVLKNSQINAVFGFLIVGFALPLYLLLLSGFPTADALKVCAMILVQIISGALIWAQVMHPRQVDIVEGVGMGLAIGSIFAVIGHQIFLPTSLRDFGWLLPVLIAAITSLAWRSTKGSHKNFVLEDASGLFFVAFAVVLILKQWWWLLPLALPTGVALYLLSNSGRNKLRNILKPSWIFVTVFFVAVTVLMVYLRQLNLDWWIRSWDVTMFESKAYSIAKYGQTQNISLLGYPMDYHWFGIAWIGKISIIGELPAWTSIAQVSPVYAISSISSLIWALGRRVQKNLLLPAIIVITLSFATPALSPANPPNIISMIWAFAATLVAYDYFGRPYRKNFFVFAVLSAASLAGKVSIGFVVLGAFTLSDFFRNLKTKTKYTYFAIRTLFLATVAISVFFFVIGGPNRLGNNTFNLSFKGPGLFFGVDRERSPLIFIVGSLGASLSIIQILLLPALALKYRLSDSRILIFTIGAFFSGYIPFLITSDDGLAYFVSNALNFAGIGSAIALVAVLQFVFHENIMTKRQVLFIGLIVLSLSKFWIKIYNLNWRELTDTRGGPTPILVAILIASLITYWFLTIIIIRPKSGKNNFELINLRIVIFALILLFANMLPSMFDRISSTLISLNSRSEVPFIGSNSVIAASQWVQSNTPDAAIIATNRFCVEIYVSECIESKYFAVSATTKRRLLIEGPGRTVGNGGDGRDGDGFESLFPKFAKERLYLSRGFADRPTAEIAARLRELGVTWFYLFLDNTENRNWAPYATVEYQNSEVAILKLTDPSS